jgi:hypothetical protein
MVSSRCPLAMAATWRTKIRPAALIGDLGIELRKVGEHSRVKIEKTFGDGKRCGSRGEALAQ